MPTTVKHGAYSWATQVERLVGGETTCLTSQDAAWPGYCHPPVPRPEHRLPSQRRGRAVVRSYADAGAPAL